MKGLCSVLSFASLVKFLLVQGPLFRIRRTYQEHGKAIAIFFYIAILVLVSSIGIWGGLEKWPPY